MTRSGEREADVSMRDDFQVVLAARRAQVEHGPGGVRDVRFSLDDPPLRVRSHLVTSGAFTFVHGENAAFRPLVLHGGAETSFVAIHVFLRGAGSVTYEGLGGALATTPGTIELFAVPNGRSTVQLPAEITNEVFRLVIAPDRIAELAGRHPPLERFAMGIASGIPLRTGAHLLAPLGRLRDDIAEIMDSVHLGPARPLFLEGRALGWIASALATTPAPSTGGLARREVDRMHQARDLLMGRFAAPPSLAEIAHAVGTNDFALKRNFKAVFGRPVHAFLLAARLAHAATLLRDTDGAIKVIAGEVGYVHATHFTAAFRRAYGVSPAEYRAKIRGGSH